MKSIALQKFMKNIYSDEKTKREFLSDPESVISKYRLTKPEKRAILSTHAKLGLMTGDCQQLETDIGPFSFWV